jgi:hypothetical protein
MNTNIPITYSQILILVLLDWIMLLFGYLGEKHMIDRKTADFCGFVPFFVIFAMLYLQFIKGNNIMVNNIIFIAYFIIWSMYGVLYMFDEKTMNKTFNILDCIAKAFVAIGISINFLLYIYDLPIAVHNVTIAR